MKIKTLRDFLATGLLAETGLCPNDQFMRLIQAGKWLTPSQLAALEKTSRPLSQRLVEAAHAADANAKAMLVKLMQEPNRKQAACAHWPCPIL